MTDRAEDPLLNNPDPSRLIVGLRDTGYDFYSAAADIIDNSIAAGATEVSVDIQLQADGRKFVFFGDNGDGMDKGGLHDAMRYGAPQRANKKSLGKFGLGLKTASSAVCLKYAVISRKAKSEPLQKLAWDLEHVQAINEWRMIEEEVTKDELANFEDLCGEKGTLVVWSKCDRLLSKNYAQPGGAAETKAVGTRIEKLREHLSLVYHKYLNPDEKDFPTVSIFVNGVAVEFWNPFYPQRAAQVLAPAETKLEMVREDGSVRSASMKAWILPHSKDMTDAENAKYAKLSNRAQGFYIHREGRLIHSGGYLGVFRSDDPHYSLFRIEFDFDNELDEAFHVDVKKSRILFDPALEEELYKRLKGPRDEADRRYRRKLKEQVASQTIDHSGSNKSIANTPNAKTATIVGVDQVKGQAVVNNSTGSGIKLILPVENNVDPKKLYVDAVEDITSGELWEPTVRSSTDSNHVAGVRLNKHHDFYTKIYTKLASNGYSVEGMDMLLWALAAAEQNYSNDELKAVWEDIREEVSSNLKKLLRHVPLPTAKEIEELTDGSDDA